MRETARKEPGTKIAAILAIAVHILFLGLLVFGVDWKTHEPEAVIVELWNRLPSAEPTQTVAPTPPAPAPKPAPEAEPEPKPEPKKAEPKPEPKAKPKVDPKPEPSKADIQLKEKQEREKKRKLKEEEDKEKLLAARDKEAKEKETKDKKAAKEKQLADIRAREELNKAAQLVEAQSRRDLGAYMTMIQNKVKPLIAVPPDIVGNPLAEFEVIQIPSGDIIKVTLVKSSGNTAYDTAVERALNKAGSLPLPKDPTLFQRELHLKFRPIPQ